MRWLSLLPLLLFFTRLSLAAPPDFNREVRPILSGHCFKCHGMDDKTRKANLRLDDRASAIASAIVPGRPMDSELIRRIRSSDEQEVMPPPSTKHPLTESEKAILERWIAAGAPYEPHWAFVPPKKPQVPANLEWSSNPIDAFVGQKLKAEGLKPSPPADRYALIRRVYLDLIGLPPTPEETDAFLADTGADAYERVVDRLLASPHYGERWARRWLDLARYADTNGYEKDRPRSIWPYRDWVINSLNADLPFDRFTIEQLAGDLLDPPNLVPTGFHRNTMLNEEGGIDPLEFRFHAMTDRVATTGAVWLGLTLGCVQCHSHKYDPIRHDEYYKFLALLNNADEPELTITDSSVAARRAVVEKQIADLEADLANRFPPPGNYSWVTPKVQSASSAGGARLTLQPDASVLASGPTPETDTYTLVLELPPGEFAALRLEALTDMSLPSTGPGRTTHGNFVLTYLEAAIERADGNPVGPLEFARAEADAAQDGFPPNGALDPRATTGWAIHVAGKWNVNRTAIFHLKQAVNVQPQSRLKLRLEQRYGSRHMLGKFRVSLGQITARNGSTEERRRAHLDTRFSEWLADAERSLVRWNSLRPAVATSNLPLLTVLDDDSVLVSGDMSKRDVYDLRFGSIPAGITAIRLECLPDPSLPRRGPGRVYYEGPHGDFFLSEISLFADQKPVKISRAIESFANGNNKAARAIDGDPLTGWSIDGSQGEPILAIFELAEPLGSVQGITLQLLFERYYAAGLGRFRVAVTTDPEPLRSPKVPLGLEPVLLKPALQRTPIERDQLLRRFLLTCPELSSEQSRLKELRSRLPSHPTTLVMQERPANNPRPTFVHHRGEFLQPREKVEPGVPAFLPQLQSHPDRLALARWLVDGQNPLTARVTVNRHWAAFFGRGLVRTIDDFGYQGEMPSHPALLDWLALEFSGELEWSVKRLHRLIVTSATYQQSSRVTPELLAKDPQNILLARGPRFRLEAELIRDSALRASNLLSERLGGPSVFPPQPPGVTSEGAYGALNWKASEGPDRYRRGLYTFAKRTAPYAAFTTFDAPSGEACVARREISNTPLQALTLLNDQVFVEAAQALGREMAARTESSMDRIRHLFRRCLVRPPSDQELHALERFQIDQRKRLHSSELDARAIAGPGSDDVKERAVWTLTARAILNLDEMISRE